MTAPPHLTIHQKILTGLLWGIWWAVFCHVLFYEWWINEQYNYGFFVPILGAYLLYMRWTDRPVPGLTGAEWMWWVVPITGILLMIPLRVILGANPEWRAALWGQALISFLATLSLLGSIGGWTWVRHFSPALVLMLFAVPWPMGIEQPMVQWLMRGVASITVEALNMLGHFAVQEGNLIRLSRGLIGVEEACSGVRSFQSTLMAAYFIGELFRWKLLHRAALILAGCTISLLLNLARTLTLTLVAISRGTDAMNVLHNPIGHFVSLGSFAILFILAWLIHRRQGEREDSPEPAPIQQSGIPSPSLQMLPSLIVLGLFAFHYAVGHLWYVWAEDPQEEKLLLQVNWEAVAKAEDREISPEVRAQLRFTDGEHKVFRWRTYLWTGFLFRWDSGKISSHIGVHRPDICLPAAGFTLVEHGAPLNWESQGVEIEFSSHVYRANDRIYYVFFTMWDSRPGYRIPLAGTWRQRLLNAWHGLRISDRQSLEMVLVGPGSLSDAEQSMLSFLEQAVEIKRQ